MNIYYRQICRIGFVSALCAFFTSGCLHNVHYEPMKKKYSFSPSLLDNAPSENLELEEKDEITTAHYTGSSRASRERMRDPNVLGTLQLKNSDNPMDDSLNFAIRKEHRAYSAETPLGESFKLGGNDITPNFSVKVHKDHDGVIGLNFRMPFSTH